MFVLSKGIYLEELLLEQFLNIPTEEIPEKFVNKVCFLKMVSNLRVYP